MEEKAQVTELFRLVREGDEEARERLYQAIYGELRALARRQMAKQSAGHTLQSTDLVHEAYLKLCNGDEGVNGRTHFFRLAATIMRQVLVDHARRRQADKRSAAGQRVELDGLVAEFERRSGGLLALDAALERLGDESPDLVKLVELRFFAGSSMGEIALALGVSDRQASRMWRSARLYLKDQLEREDA